MTLHFEKHDRMIFWVFVIFFIASIILYLYFLSASIFDVVARKSAEQEISAAMARISVLETQHASLNKDINLAFAQERGFIEIPVPKHVTSATIRSTALTLRHHDLGAR